MIEYEYTSKSKELSTCTADTHSGRTLRQFSRSTSSRRPLDHHVQRVHPSPARAAQPRTVSRQQWVVPDLDGALPRQ